MVVELLARIVFALLSGSTGARRNWVAEDWAAVSQALQQRLKELGMTQIELCRRSNVSKAIVGELVRHSEERDRHANTLEALSAALNWKRSHLAAVRDGIAPPQADEPEVISDKDIPGRLSAVEHNVRKMTSLNETTNKLLAELIESMDKERRWDEISLEFQAVVRRLFIEFLPPKKR